MHILTARAGPVKVRGAECPCAVCAGTGFQPLEPPLEPIPCDECDGTGTRPVQVRAPSVPTYFAMAGDEVVQVARDVPWLLRDLVEHGVHTDLCLWRQQGDDWEPAWTLVGVLRPQAGGDMAVTWV